jgi:hypothetical protein
MIHTHTHEVSTNVELDKCRSPVPRASWAAGYNLNKSRYGPAPCSGERLGKQVPRTTIKPLDVGLLPLQDRPKPG